MKVLSEPLTLPVLESTPADLNTDSASHPGISVLPQGNTASSDGLTSATTLEFSDSQVGCESAKKQSSVFSVFWSTFLTIFLAEIGDKTQLTTLLMSAESHSPWIVFAGAGTALVATSLIGVLLGQWLASRVSAKTLEKAAAVTLLIISATLIWDVLH